MTKYAARSLVLEVDSAPIAQVTAVGEAGSSRDLIDASAHGDDWKDYVLGQQDGAELAVTIALDPADTDHWALVDAYNGATTTNFSMTEATSGFDINFPGIITTLTRGGTRDGLLQMSATIKIVQPGVTDSS